MKGSWVSSCLPLPHPFTKNSSNYWLFLGGGEVEGVVSGQEHSRLMLSLSDINSRALAMSQRLRNLVDINHSSCSHSLSELCKKQSNTPQMPAGLDVCVADAKTHVNKVVQYCLFDFTKGQIHKTLQSQVSMKAELLHVSGHPVARLRGRAAPSFRQKVHQHDPQSIPSPHTDQNSRLPSK